MKYSVSVAFVIFTALMGHTFGSTKNNSFLDTLNGLFEKVVVSEHALELFTKSHGIRFRIIEPSGTTDSEYNAKIEINNHQVLLLNYHLSIRIIPLLIDNSRIYVFERDFHHLDTNSVTYKGIKFSGNSITELDDNESKLLFDRASLQLKELSPP